MCRGSSVPKILVREAKSHANVKVIVGISRTNHTIWRPPAWVAKYCARKLSSNFSVFAVDNGKIVFQRRATAKTTDYSRGWNYLLHVFFRRWMNFGARMMLI